MRSTSAWPRRCWCGRPGCWGVLGQGETEARCDAHVWIEPGELVPLLPAGRPEPAR